MKLSLRELLGRFRAKRRKAWVDELSAQQRRTLAANLRDLTESKRSIERRLNAGTPQR